MARVARCIYRYTIEHLAIGGKQVYFVKFKPNTEQDALLPLIFPTRISEPLHIAAMAHAVFNSIRRLLLKNGRR
jgi:hypothetical protein